MLHLSSFVGMDDNDAGDIYGEAGSLSWQRRRAGRERNSRIMLCHSGPKWGVIAMVIMMLMLVIISGDLFLFELNNVIYKFYQ